MAKHTETIEREVVETVEEEQTFWTCDDCRLEYDEEELVPVAVAPGVEVDEVSWSWLEANLGNAVEGVGTCFAMGDSRNSPAIERAVSRHTREILEKWRRRHQEPETTAAATLDVCPGCLEENYGIELTERDGELFEERNVQVDKTVEKTSIWPSLDFHGPWIASFGGCIPVFGIVMMAIAWIDGNGGDAILAGVFQILSLLVTAWVLFF